MDQNQLKQYLNKTWKFLEKAEKKRVSTPILNSNDPTKVRASLNKQLPVGPESYEQVLSDFEEQIFPFLNQNTDTRYGAYITGSGNKVSALAEFIKAFYNQNGLKWNNSPIASELEQLVIAWIAEFTGLEELNKGIITSGGSMSNLMSIHFALASRYPEREMKGLYQERPFRIYCSDQTHSSVDRAMVFLSLGRDNLRKIEVNERFEIRLDLLREAIEEDLKAGFQPMMIIGNAGTTNTGTIDDLSGLAELAKKYKLWYHVDGAYGLPARRLPELASKFDGIDQADSVIINPHKWMYVTFEASCVLLKEIPEAIHFSPDYLFTEDPGLRWESAEHTIELSKEFRALKIWFTMKYYGTDELTRFVRHDIDMADYLAEELTKRAYIMIEPEHPLSILCFRIVDETRTSEQVEQINIQAVRQIESRGEIFITGTKLHEQTYLRVYFGNPDRTKADVDHMMQEIDRVYRDVMTTVL